MLRVEVTVVEGWCSVEELVRWGFGQAPVVMANEAHNGLKHCVRTREIGIRMVRAAHEAGVRRLAMEALGWPEPGVPGPIRAMPEPGESYLAQPDMRRLIGTALELGWSLWAYEAVFDITADLDQDTLLSREFTNWREREQANNLRQLTAADPAEPLLVWCGNGHATKQKFDDWVPMGWHFRAMSGIEAFAIDQTVTVTFSGREQPWVPELLADHAETLAAHGGTAGILSDQVQPPLYAEGYDAIVISTENALT